MYLLRTTDKRSYVVYWDWHQRWFFCNDNRNRMTNCNRNHNRMTVIVIIIEWLIVIIIKRLIVIIIVVMMSYHVVIVIVIVGVIIGYCDRNNYNRNRTRVLAAPRPTARARCCPLQAGAAPLLRRRRGARDADVRRRAWPDSGAPRPGHARLVGAVVARPRPGGAVRRRRSVGRDRRGRPQPVAHRRTRHGATEQRDKQTRPGRRCAVGRGSVYCFSFYRRNAVTLLVS